MKIAGIPPSLSEIDADGNTKEIKTVKSCLLLGAQIQDNMTWSYHLEAGKGALLPETRKKTQYYEALRQVHPKKRQKAPH